MRPLLACLLALKHDPVGWLVGWLAVILGTGPSSGMFAGAGQIVLFLAPEGVAELWAVID